MDNHMEKIPDTSGIGSGSSDYFFRDDVVRLSREQRPGDLPTNIGGIACYYKSRRAVRAGTYIDANGRTVTITPKMLDHLCYQFQRMKDAGVKVPLELIS